MKKLEKQKQGLLNTLAMDLGSSEMDFIYTLLDIQTKLTIKEMRDNKTA